MYVLMRVLLLLLVCCWVAPGGSFVPHVTSSLSAASKSQQQHGSAVRSVCSSCRSSAFSASRASSGSSPLRGVAVKMSQRADDGRGGDTPRENSAIASLEAQIEAVGDEIRETNTKIEAVEDALSGGPPFLGSSDRGFLSKQLDGLRLEKQQLLRKEEQLRRKEEQLREKELLQRRAQASFTTPADNRLAEFAAALTEAVVTNNTLELANGTFFLDDSRLGFKLYIRPCYKELAEILLGGAWTKSTVVSGTPGIGKSCFALYLLYLLRCQGTTVVLERKRDWYRFSNEGVMKGNFYDFGSKGYLDDKTAWYLSDPDDRPFRGFLGVTVVFASPNYRRTNEFLKIDKAVRVFMPVWNVTELLDCRLAVYPHVPVAVVEERCRIVGGVARAVFEEEKFQRAEKRMHELVTKLDAGMLREATLTAISGDSRSIDAPDKLFHIFSDSSDNFKGYRVMLASDYAGGLLKEAVAGREISALLAFVGAAINSTLLPGGTVGALFELGAHKVLGGEGGDQTRFKMAILSGSEVLSGEELNFGFTETKAFNGKNIPSEFDIGVYYRPEDQTFAAIDSFGVDSHGTLFFFQMKYRGVETMEGKGQHVERYWGTAVKSTGVSVKNCIFVYVVPEETQWTKSMELSRSRTKRPWLPGASSDFLSKCGVCVVGIRSRPIWNIQRRN